MDSLQQRGGWQALDLGVTPDPGDTPDPEVPFEEAHPRRRRRVAAAWLLAAMAGAALAAGLGAGRDSPTRPPEARAAAGARPGRAPLGVWDELSAPGAYIAPGAIVTDVVRWRGVLYAASQGSGRVRVPGARGCPAGNSCAVVWRSVHGRRWRAVYAATSLGGGQGEWLLPLRGALLLGDSGEFSALWRTANGSTWRPVRLPVGLADGGISGTSLDGGRRVLLVGNGTSLPPRDSHLPLAWAAASSLRLRPAVLPKGVRLSHVLQGAGLQAAGTADHGHGIVILRSSTGGRWRIAATLRVPPALRDSIYGSLGAVGRTLVTVRTPAPVAPSGRVQLWYSETGRRWRLASVQGALPLAGGRRYAPTAFPEVLAAHGGVVLYDATNTAFWFSASGRVWRRVQVRDTPPANLAPQGLQGLDVVGGELIAIEHASRSGHGVPAGATTFWRLELSGT